MLVSKDANMKNSLIFAILFVLGCAAEGLPQSDTGAQTDTETQTYTGPSRGPGSVTVTNTFTATKTEPTVADTRTLTATETHTVSITNTNTATASQSNTNTATSVETVTKTETNTQTKTEPATKTSTSTLTYTVTSVSTGSTTSTYTATSVDSNVVDLCTSAAGQYYLLSSKGVTAYPGYSFSKEDRSGNQCNDILPANYTSTLSCTEFAKQNSIGPAVLCFYGAECGYCKSFCGFCN